MNGTARCDPSSRAAASRSPSSIALQTEPAARNAGADERNPVAAKGAPRNHKKSVSLDQHLH